MPFIGNVFLVVSSDSQVPEWADRSELRVVLHKDIIPAGLLPVFNSCTIEMFLHRIPGLAEEFIYFNDDMFPLALCKSTDFFRDGKGVIGISHQLFAGNMYKKQCRTSDRMARKAAGKKACLGFVRPQHICSPMLKSLCEKAFLALEEDILATASRTRTPRNPNQYMYLDYMYFSGSIVPERISNRHISQGVWPAEKIADYILHPRTSLACINDVEMPEDKAVQMQEQILNAFERRFPVKSTFEI
jgi:hypothetical protein